MFNNVYSGKRVLITGHTGFKGSWLSIWLKKLGAEVYGLSDCVPTVPSIYETASLEKSLKSTFADIRDFNAFHAAIEEVKPDFIFHLAAQAIVSNSYSNPIDTITRNVNGTSIVLEALRVIDHPCVAIIITSDKCYENVEWLWGYKETDHLGGKDIYSASKACAEIIFHAYYNSFFKSPQNNVRMATARAGNVIGGGDWAKDRIVADCMRNWSNGKPVEIRSPKSTRPWQHVLEPLSGYLTLGSNLFMNEGLVGESFNFGPRAEQNRTVLQLLSDLSSYWDFNDVKDAYIVTADIPFHEAGLLKLHCDKAIYDLKWEANLNYDQCVQFVSEWYFSYYKNGSNVYQLTLDQIDSYEKIAIENGLIWTK